MEREINNKNQSPKIKDREFEFEPSMLNFLSVEFINLEPPSLLVNSSYSRSGYASDYSKQMHTFIGNNVTTGFSIAGVSGMVIGGALVAPSLTAGAATGWTVITGGIVSALGLSIFAVSIGTGVVASTIAISNRQYFDALYDFFNVGLSISGIGGFLKIGSSATHRILSRTIIESTRSPIGFVTDFETSLFNNSNSFEDVQLINVESEFKFELPVDQGISNKH